MKPKPKQQKKLHLYEASDA